MDGSAAELVIEELISRGTRPWTRRPRPARPTSPTLLDRPAPTSIRVLSERKTPEQQAAAVAVDDVRGARFIVIGVFVVEHGVLRGASGCETLYRDGPSQVDPRVGLYAYAGGRFFAGGRVQSGKRPVASVRLIWEDGYELQDEVENGIVMFMGVRDSLTPARCLFLDPFGCPLGSQQVLGADERNETASGGC